MSVSTSRCSSRIERIEFISIFCFSLVITTYFRSIAEGGGSTESSGSGSRDDFAEILGAGRNHHAESPGKNTELGTSLPFGSWTKTPATSPGT